METLKFNQGFLSIRQTSKYWLFNLVVFLTICQVKSEGASVLKNVALLKNFNVSALRRHLGAFIVVIAEIPCV